MNSPLMSSVLSAVIVGALCFSVGEGLRLTPFSFSASSQTEEAQFSFANPSGKTFFSKYGPLDVPTQNQKRSKRQVDFAGPAVAGTRYVLPELRSFVEYKSENVASALFVARPSGRAPPFLS